MFRFVCSLQILNDGRPEKPEVGAHDDHHVDDAVELLHVLQGGSGLAFDRIKGEEVPFNFLIFQRPGERCGVKVDT